MFNLYIYLLFSSSSILLILSKNQLLIALYFFLFFYLFLFQFHYFLHFKNYFPPPFFEFIFLFYSKTVGRLGGKNVVNSSSSLAVLQVVAFFVISCYYLSFKVLKHLTHLVLPGFWLYSVKDMGTFLLATQTSRAAFLFMMCAF